VPTAVVRSDRRAGRGQPPVHPRAEEDPHPSAGRPRTRPGAVAADKAYSSRANRAQLRKRRIKAVIPEKKDQIANRKKKGSRGGRPVTFDAELYRDRNTVERLINRLKDWRGIATRFDKTPESYLAGLELSASMIWVRDLCDWFPARPFVS
jgi:transposase